MNFRIKLDFECELCKVGLRRTLLQAKQKIMNIVQKLFHIAPRVISEDRHFKKSGVVYASRKMNDGTIWLWAIPPEGSEVYLGKVTYRVWEKPEGFVKWYYRDQKYAELLARIIREDWKKPYRLWEREANMYR